MTDYAYHLIDNNTGEEIYASDGFSFTAVPSPEHRLHDPVLMERYGGPAIVNRVEQIATPKGTDVKVYIDGVEERLNGQDADETYRRS